MDLKFDGAKPKPGAKLNLRLALTLVLANSGGIMGRAGAILHRFGRRAALVTTLFLGLAAL